MENLPTPLSRVELYLAKACGMDVTVPEQPSGRLEQFLAILAGDTSITMPTPIGLTEQWLAYVLGVTPDPLLAVEGACLIGAQKVDVRYFAVAASMPGATLPEAPQNRAEMYWAHIAGNPPTPGILKYVSGKYFYLTDVVSGIEELQFVYGDTYQQTYSGKNLFNVNGDFSYGGYTNQTTKNGDGTITVSANFSVSRNAGQKLNLLPNTQYVLSCTMTATTSTQPHKGIIEIMKGIRYVNLSNLVTKYVDTVGEATFTFTTPADVSEIWIEFSSNGTATSTFANIQIEQGSTPTSYEPYTGGIPAPNPDYPQAVQTVTGAQTVDVTGKNLVRIGTYEISGTNYGLKANYGNIKLTSTTTNNSFDLNAGTRTGVYLPSYAQANDYHLTRPGGTYTVSAQNLVNRSSGSGNVILQTFTNKRTSGRTITTTATSVLPVTISLDDDEYIKSIYIWTPSSSTIDMEMDIQLEEGSTVTAYEPYQGQSYPIDLGSTELCKIGTYQDEIFNNDPNEDWYDPDLEDNAWYVHKEFGKYIFNGTETIAYNSSNKGFTINPTDLSNYMPNHATPPMVGLSTHFSVNSTTSTWTGDNRIGLSSAGTFWCKATSFATSESDCHTWLTANTPSVYYALATATDTKITDATLISQLDALNSATLPKPIANITVSATGTNLTPYLTIAYYGSDEE